MGIDYIMNGQPHGNTATKLLQSGGDPATLRPYLVQSDGKMYNCMTVNSGGKQETVLTNTSATLLKDEWQIIDEVVIKVAKQRLRAVGDLREAGLQFTIPEGMGKTVLQYQAQSDISAAIIAMDPRNQSQSDRPTYDLLNLPLPIISKDFSFGIRELMESRNRGNPLDTTTAELAGRRVAEQAEALLLGTAGAYTYGGGSIYGYTNFPQRMTKTMANPTGGSWTANDTIQDVLAMRLQSKLEFHYGPWMLYTSPLWDEFMDADYSSAKGDRTLRERLKVIQGILDVRTLDYLTGYTMILVQMSSDVVRMVVGMDIVTVQWETMGGMEANFKVMCIIVPQLRYDHNSNTGIVHGTAP